MEYKKLVNLYIKLDKTSKRLEKTYLISEFLKSCNENSLKYIILLLQGKIFPDYDEREINIGTSIVIKSLSKSTGIEVSKINNEWRKLGDLGEVAEKLVDTKKQQTLFSDKLTVKKVYENLKKLALLEGKGTVENKIGLISELLTSSNGKEAKFIIRTLLQDLRIGIGEGSLRDTIALSFLIKTYTYNPDKKTFEFEDREEYNKAVNSVQHAYNLINDFSEIAVKAKKDGIPGLDKIKLESGRPIKVMLALKAKDISDGFQRVGKPAQLEYKYDGFRIQAHKKEGKIKLYTRRLEDVTEQFPDVIKALEENVNADSYILDSEAVGYSPKTKKCLPFQKISQRIKRKYDILDIAKKFPVELNVFDIILYNDKNMLNHKFKERRNILEKIIKIEKRKIVIAIAIVTEKEEEALEFYKKSLDAGNEGMMMKNLDSPYKPGARVGYMIKVKPTMENLDLVIIKAEWGTGKRANWLSSFTLACVNEEDKFLEIGKVSTGLKEKEEEEGISFESMTNMLKQYIIKDKARKVWLKPKIVIEVAYEEIQKSPTYSSGYALRFPRFVNLREDRRPEEASTLNYVEELYYTQN